MRHSVTVQLNVRMGRTSDLCNFERGTPSWAFRNGAQYWLITYSNTGKHGLLMDRGELIQYEYALKVGEEMCMRERDIRRGRQ